MAHFLTDCKIILRDKAPHSNYAFDAYQHTEALSRYNFRERAKTAERTAESRSWINLECLRRGLLSVVVRQATRRQYECKDLPSPPDPPPYSPTILPRFKGSPSHTTPLSSSSRKTRRREVCAQLRGCNPRHDETSIVITELSGKPPLHRAA